MSNRKLGYWFGDNELPNGDGRKVRKGGTLNVKPPLKLCNRGLHYSKHPFDALAHAATNQLWLIEDVGETLAGDDKCCTTARKHLAKIDAEPILRDFARWCALSVIDQWDAPEIVLRYLKTGDESIRSLAGSAAWSAAEAAAQAEADARSAVRSSADFSAAFPAAFSASYEAFSATWTAGRTAAWAAGRTAAAAGSAARAAQRRKFKRMIDAEFRRIGAL